MLNRTSIKVLCKLKKVDFKYQNIDAFCAILPKLSKHDVEQTLWYLHSQGYIHCQPGDGTIYALEPTYAGEHFQEFDWAETKSFVLRSIVTPIAVSAVTTLLTLFISGTLGL